MFITSICGAIIAIISTQIMLTSVFRRLYFINNEDRNNCEFESINHNIIVFNCHFNL